MQKKVDLCYLNRTLMEIQLLIEIKNFKHPIFFLPVKTEAFIFKLSHLSNDFIIARMTNSISTIWFLEFQCPLEVIVWVSIILESNFEKYVSIYIRYRKIILPK